MVTKRPLITLIILIFIIFSALPALFCGAGFAASADSQDIITCTQEAQGVQYFSEEGIIYKIACPADTVSLTFTFETDYKDDQTGAVDLELNPGTGKKEGRLRVYENGIIVFKAKVERHDTEFYLDYTLNVDKIDYVAPVLKEDREDFLMEGGRLVKYWIFADDYLLLQKKTAASGLDAVIVFCDIERKSDPGLPDKVTPEDIEENAGLTVIKSRKDLSKISRLQQLSLDFDIGPDGYYYVYTSDTVGNSAITKILDIRQEVLYKVTVNGVTIDCGPVIDSANRMLEDGEGLYSQVILDNLEEKLFNLLFAFQSGSKTDGEIKAAYHELRDAQTACTDAKAEFKLEIVNAEQFPGVISVINLNSTNFDILLGETVTAMVTVLEETNTPSFKSQREAAELPANRSFKLVYTLQKDGQMIVPKAPLVFYVSIPESFEQAALLSAKEGGYQKEIMQKGGEWLQFSTSYGEKTFLIAVYDSAYTGKKSLLWLYITSGALAIAGGAAAVTIVLSRRKRAGKAEKNNSEKTDK